ncbi:hypothetical protein Trydic_g7720 [Trypoxylus dichotomus]
MYPIMRQTLKMQVLEEALESTVALINKDLPIQMEWEIVEHLCNVLKPFENATKAISGEYYCTASLAIPIANGLINVYKGLATKQYPETVKSMILEV